MALRPKKDLSDKDAEGLEEFCDKTKGFYYDPATKSCQIIDVCSPNNPCSGMTPICDPVGDGLNYKCLCDSTSCKGGRTCVGGTCYNCEKGEKCNCSGDNVSDGSGGCYTPKDSCNPNPCSGETPSCSALDETQYSCSCTSESCPDGKKCSDMACQNCSAGDDCGCSYYGKEADGNGSCRCPGVKIDDGKGGCKCPDDYESDGQGGCKYVESWLNQCPGKTHSNQRVKATKTFTTPIGTIQMGQTGGAYCKSDALNFSGPAWIGDDAYVGCGAKVYGNGLIYDGATAMRNAEIYENAQVYGMAVIGTKYDPCGSHVWDESDYKGSPKIHGNAKVYGKARVYGQPDVYGNAEIYGNATVYGDSTKVYGNAKICNDTVFTGTLSTCDKRYCSDCP